MQTKRKNKLILSLALVFLCTCVVGVKPKKAEAKRINISKVRNAIDISVEYLWSQQKKDGSWPRVDKYRIGPTAIAVYALLSAGENVSNPRIRKALDWLGKKKNQTQLVYEMGMRCNAYEMAARQNYKKYRNSLKKESNRLRKYVHKSGGYGYVVPHTKKALRHAPHGHNPIHVSTAQYGVLGYWAGVSMGALESNTAYWKRVNKWWIKQQNADGGWPYDKTVRGWQLKSSGSMTTAGIATMFLCFDYLNSSKFLKCRGGEYPKAIKRGLQWMNKHAALDIKDHTRHHKNWYTYYLYGLERVGLAAGYKYFGKVDWYKQGALKLLKDHETKTVSWTDPTGEKHTNVKVGFWQYYRKPRVAIGVKTVDPNYNTVIDTSFAIIFLSRGLHPIGFNKLRFNGDWNNRPRDLAGLTLYISRSYEQDMRWQIVNLQVPSNELHDSRFLYISAKNKFEYTKAEVDKVRRYILQGGTILSLTECKGEGFETAIRKFYKEMFPNYKLVALKKSHPIYTKPHKFKRKKDKPKILVLTNGARVLAYHIPEDLAKSWHIGARGGRRFRNEQDFQIIGPNMLSYQIGGFRELTPRGTFFWPRLPKAKPQYVTNVARLVVKKTNCNPEPLAFEKLDRMLQSVSKTKLAVKNIDPKALNNKQFQVAVLTGTGKLNLSSKQKNAIKKFVDNGGLLYVEAVGGNKKFAKSAKSELKDIFGSAAIRELPLDNPVYKDAKPTSKKKKKRMRVFRKSAKMSGSSKYQFALRGYTKGNKTAIIFSEYDLSVGLLNMPSGSVKGYVPECSWKLLRNIMNLRRVRNK